MNGDKDYGYIKQSRKQFQGDDLLWDDGTPFDSRSAWTWLIQTAAWKDTMYHSRGRMDALKRGEFVASVRFLGSRWGWDKNAVHRFLKLLQQTGRINHVRVGQHGHVYHIVKYDTYQLSTLNAGTVKPPASGTQSGTPTGQYDLEKWDKEEGSKELKAIYTTDFEVLWQRYPKRAGSNPKRRAFQAYGQRLSEGHTHDVMLAGTDRMAGYVRSEKSEGTRYVLQTATFLGPDLRFLEPWHISASVPKNGQRPDETPAEYQARKRGYV